jgi:TBC1 domain family member 15
MTIELDTTLAQAEVLFLSFAQLVADIDRRQAENEASASGLRRRVTANAGTPAGKAKEMNVRLPELSDNLRDLLKVAR